MCVIRLLCIKTLLHMLRKFKLLSLISLLVLVIAACDKGKDTGNHSSLKNLPGTLYWFFAGSAGYYELSANRYVEEMMKMGSASSRFDAFDISWDNRKIMLTMDVEGTFNFDERRIVLRNKTDNITYSEVQSGNNITDFSFEWEDISDVYGHISPNEKYVAVDAQHFSDLPVAIVGVDEKEIISGWKVDGVSLLDYGIPVWTADNKLYFRILNNLYQSSPEDEYVSANHILTMENGSSFVTVNPQGTKIAFRRNKHLWMCNIDGSGLQQITTAETSNVIDYDGERKPVFSPDGKYIAFTGATQRGTPWSDHNYPDGGWVAATGGKYGYIIIIPADGKLYNLDDKNSGAIWLKKPGDNVNGIPCSGSLIWR